jgi:hypothetical protein
MEVDHAEGFPRREAECMAVLWGDDVRAGLGGGVKEGQSGEDLWWVD